MATVVAGLADLRRWAEQSPRPFYVAIALAEMHAVRAEPLRQRNAVVEDERDIGIGANPLQRFGEPG